MKLIYAFPLLSSLFLMGCIEEPKTKTNASAQSYGVNYTGQTSWAELTTIAELQTFVDVFELYHRNQGLMDYWPSQLIGLTPDADLTNFDTDSCGKNNTIGFSLASIVSDVEGVEAGDEISQEVTGFVNKALFSSYCYADLAWNTHTTENGSIMVDGQADDYLTSFNRYEKSIPAHYQIRFGGTVLNKPSASQPSKTYNLVISQDQMPSLTAKFEDFKVSESADGQFYTGTMYHPNYGKVFVTTLLGTENLVVTADEDVLVNRPISGTLKLTATSGNTAYIHFSADSTYNLALDLGSNNVSDFELAAQTWPAML